MALDYRALVPGPFQEIVMQVQSALIAQAADLRTAVEKTPANASATGTKGEWCYDANFIYVCIATNTWKRVAISTW